MLPECCLHAATLLLGTLLSDCLCLVDGETAALNLHLLTRHERNLIKGLLASLRILQCSLPQREPSELYSHLNHSTLFSIFFTMMFYNTLFSFVAAIALASGVTAAVMPRGGGGGGEGGPQGGQTCITGSLSCCTSVSPFSSLSENEFGGLLNILDPNVNADVPIGLNCALSGVAGWYCSP